MPSTESVTNNSVDQLSWVDKQSRRVALKLLSYLKQGQLHLQEQNGEQWHFGDPNSDIKAHVTVLDGRFYRRLLVGGSIAAGETYVDNYWQTPDLTSVIRIFARNLPALDKLEGRLGWLSYPMQRLSHWRRRNHKQQAKQNIAAHYDLGNELYRRFLDPRMQYSSAIYKTSAMSLADAQAAKLTALCGSLKLTADDHLLEIGTGWGGLAVFAAQRYGCRVTTTTISAEQYRYAQEQVAAHGLTQQITLLKEDYRDLQGQYDKLVSVEMIEAVGKRYLPSFFKQCNRLLKDNGKMALQAITIADQRMNSYARSVDFIQRHIFPGGFLPSLQLMLKLFTEHTDMVVRQVQDIGLDYAQTLRDWRKNFDQHLPELAEYGYDERFKRLWHYYLSYCEGGFSERTVSALQLLATKPAARGPL